MSKRATSDHGADARMPKQPRMQDMQALLQPPPRRHTYDVEAVRKEAEREIKAYANPLAYVSPLIWRSNTKHIEDAVVPFVQSNWADSPVTYPQADYCKANEESDKLWADVKRDVKESLDRGNLPENILWIAVRNGHGRRTRAVLKELGQPLHRESSPIRQMLLNFVTEIEQTQGLQAACTEAFKNGYAIDEAANYLRSKPAHSNRSTTTSSPEVTFDQIKSQTAHALLLGTEPENILIVATHAGFETYAKKAMQQFGYTFDSSNNLSPLPAPLPMGETRPMSSPNSSDSEQADDKHSDNSSGLENDVSSGSESDADHTSVSKRSDHTQEKASNEDRPSIRSNITPKQSRSARLQSDDDNSDDNVPIARLHPTTTSKQSRSARLQSDDDDNVPIARLHPSTASKQSRTARLQSDDDDVPISHLHSTTTSDQSRNAHLKSNSTTMPKPFRPQAPSLAQPSRAPPRAEPSDSETMSELVTLLIQGLKDLTTQLEKFKTKQHRRARA
jgi:hypothetical protein